MKCSNCGLVISNDEVKCECGYSFTTSKFYRSYEDILKLTMPSLPRKEGNHNIEEVAK